MHAHGLPWSFSNDSLIVHVAVGKQPRSSKIRIVHQEEPQTESKTPERQPAASQHARQTRGRSNSATTVCFPSSIAGGGHKPIYFVDRHSGAGKHPSLENVRSKERARGYYCHIRKAWKDKPADVKQTEFFPVSVLRVCVRASARQPLGVWPKCGCPRSSASLRFVYVGRILFKKLNSCAFNEKEIFG